MAVIAAVIALPLAFAAFAAVEFHRMTTVRSELQSALDTATLAVARSPMTDPAALNALGLTVLKDNMASRGASLAITASFVDANGYTTGDATVVIQPLISGLLSPKGVTVKVSSKYSLVGDRLEIALVLDNTYSMEWTWDPVNKVYVANTRLQTTKTAAVNFLTTLEGMAAQTGSADALKVSLVPFSSTVRVAPTPTNTPPAWIDGNALSPIHGQNFSVSTANRFTMLKGMGQTWGGCVEGRPMRATSTGIDYDVTDAAADANDPRSLFVPYFAPDEPDGWNAKLWGDGSTRYTNDYMTDNTTATDEITRQRNVTKYQRVNPDGTPRQPDRLSAIGAGYFYGPNYGCTLQPVVPLTATVSTVKTAINNMVGSTDTNIPIGLVWGWHTLSPNGPFTGASRGAAYGSGVRKIVVLMTDGENSNYNNALANQSLYSSISYIGHNRIGIIAGTPAERRAAMDARLTLLCENMKAKGIELHTIRVEVPSTSTVLSKCAGNGGEYYDVTVASQLDATFKKIADSILNPKLMP